MFQVTLNKIFYIKSPTKALFVMTNLLLGLGSRHNTLYESFLNLCSIYFGDKKLYKNFYFILEIPLVVLLFIILSPYIIAQPS